MQYDELIARVRSRAELHSDEDARRATEATLTTLSERLAGGESRDLLSQLPKAIREAVPPFESATRYDVAGFLARVAEREETTIEQAWLHARAVFHVLQEAVSPGEIADVRSQLPKEYAILLEGAGTQKRHP